MNDPSKANARMRAPTGPRVARIEGMQSAFNAASDRALPLKALFMRALSRASVHALPAHSSPDQCATSLPLRKDECALKPEADALPAALADLASRVCLWRIETPGGQSRYVVAGPDHDLRVSEPSAVPLFGENHRDMVRRLPDVDVKDGD